MKRFIAVSLVGALFLGISAYASGDEEPNSSKRADIRALLELTGALEVAQQMSELMVAQMTETLKEARPDIEPWMYDVLRDEVNSAVAESIPAFVELIVPVYQRHFTHAEIRELLAFYETDLGRKTIAVMPSVMRDSMLAGQQWGRALAPAIQERVRRRFSEEGVDLSA